MDNKTHLHIIGLGLIGGSVAGGLREAPYTVSGWDTEESTRQEALDRELIESVYPPDDLPESVSGVLLAIPVPEMVPVTETLMDSNHLPEFITDVGSTKSWVCDRMKSLLKGEPRFIGAHPMAGSEESGLSAADPILFENAISVITPTVAGEKHLLDVIQIWETLGAHVLEMSPDQHDTAVAHVSHLPHLNAAALLQTIQEVPNSETQALPLAAGGFRDTTRVAEGDPGLWRDIFKTNKDRITSGIENFVDVLKEAKAYIENDEWEEITRWLDEARQTRDEIPEKTKGLLGSLFELKILAPDKPGILAHITGTLAEESINITDIEVLKIREGELGTIRLRFRRQDQLEEARQVLTDTDEEIRII
ncbi:MAG: prephenate dehydrogenase/arogenate dehydrogenase family protein [bacterium]